MDDAVILSVKQVLRGESGVFPPRRDPEEMIDGSAVQAGLQSAGNAVDIVPGIGSHELRLGIMVADDADCRIVPPDDGDTIGRSWEAWRGVRRAHNRFP